MTIPARYENGVFRPLEDVKIKEGTVVEILVPVEQQPSGKRPSIKDLPFYGIWKDRVDIGDGVDCVNKLRDMSAVDSLISASESSRDPKQFTVITTAGDVKRSPAPRDSTYRR